MQLIWIRAIKASSSTKKLEDELNTVPEFKSESD